MMAKRQLVTLTDYAFRERITYRRAYDQLMTGQIEGVRDGSRWHVIVRGADQARELATATAEKAK